jgi:hypothetical protein
MTNGFRRVGDGRIGLDLAPEEGAVLRGLVEQLLELMEALPAGDPGLAELGISESTEAPADPALARLFPDGYRDDPDAAGEFRRYTESGLRDGKREAAETVLKGLAETKIVLDDVQAHAWLRCLNDLRLTLGTRLEVTEDFYERAEELDWDDPRYALYAVYDWLGLLQDTLVRSLW